MRRFITWAALVALILGLVLSVGCQQAKQQDDQSTQGTGGTTDDSGTMMEGAGDSTDQMQPGETMHEEAGDMMQQETGEATGTN